MRSGLRFSFSPLHPLSTPTTQAKEGGGEQNRTLAIYVTVRNCSTYQDQNYTCSKLEVYHKVSSHYSGLLLNRIHVIGRFLLHLCL